MPGFYDVTRDDVARKVTFRRIEGPRDAMGQVVYLEDAAIAKLPAAIDTMPFADLVTYDAAVKTGLIHQIDYDDDKGPLYITLHPASANPAPGVDQAFAVDAKGGTGTKTYQWYFEGYPIPGATTDVYEIKGVTLKNAGRYKCVITAGGETLTTNTATLTTTASKITAVGKTQYSADGSTWADAIPDGVMVAGAPVDFYVRTNPASLAAPDDGGYVYAFQMATVGAGGLSLRNDSPNRARITGTTPSDQKGLKFSVNTTVHDSAGGHVTGTALEKVWA